MSAPEARPRLLLADDDAVARMMLERALLELGYEVQLATDGLSAWQLLSALAPPRIAVIDWMMPAPDGVELCRRLRRLDGPLIYTILLTGRGGGVVEALDAGAHDFLTKPVDLEELRSRLDVGRRLIAAEDAREAVIAELQAALAEVDTLRGLLPICANCRSVKDRAGYWRSLEDYIARNTPASFSHGLCEGCTKELYPDVYEEMAADGAFDEERRIRAEVEAREGPPDGGDVLHG